MFLAITAIVYALIDIFFNDGLVYILFGLIAGAIKMIGIHPSNLNVLPIAVFIFLAIIVSFIVSKRSLTYYSSAVLFIPSLYFVDGLIYFINVIHFVDGIQRVVLFFCLRILLFGVVLLIRYLVQRRMSLGVRYIFDCGYEASF